jgi:hypothetical protein
MVLNPLAEIVVAVLMPVRVRSGQFVVNILSHGEWRKGYEKEDEADRQPSF